MDKSSVCRICLVENIRMFCVLYTNLQETYERLTGLPFITKDSRPSQVCYICCARLRNCYKLQTTCLQSEEFFTEILENNQLKQKVLQDRSILKIVHPVVNWSSVALSPDDVPVDIIIDDEDDDVIFCDNNHNVEMNIDVKVEVVEDNIERIAVKYTSPNDTTSPDVFSLEDNVEHEGNIAYQKHNNKPGFNGRAVKPKIIDLVTIEDVELSNSSRNDASTAEQNIIDQVNNVKRIVTNNAPSLEVGAVNVIHQVESIEDTETNDTLELDYSSSTVETEVMQPLVNIVHTDVVVVKDYITKPIDRKTEHTKPPRLNISAITDDRLQRVDKSRDMVLNNIPKFEVSTVAINQGIGIKYKMPNASKLDVSKPQDDIINQEIGITCAISNDTHRIDNALTLEDNNTNQEDGNEYAAHDMFRCDDLNAVEGNFLGHEVIIDNQEEAESMDIVTIDNIVNNTADAQDSSSGYIEPETSVLEDINTEQNNAINKDISVEFTAPQNTPTFNDSNKKNDVEKSATVECIELKNDPKLDNPNSIENNQENNTECIDPNVSPIIANVSDEKDNFADTNDELNIEDDVEEKYNIGTESDRTNDEDRNKKVFNPESPAKDIFRKDVMVVLHKLELDGIKTSEDLNFEGENKDIGVKEHRRLRSSRKRKSSVLKEAPQTANTRKYVKKVRFEKFKRHKKHEKVNIDKKPFICDICNKCFILKHHLIEHKRKHTGEKPYKCDICEQRFYYQNVLNNHIASHSNLRPHKCNICGKCYGLKVNLMRHIRVHTCEKPYKCDVCGKCFGYKQHLTTHTRIHTGERPFPCHLCEKRFNQRNNLNTHLRSMHAGEKHS